MRREHWKSAACNLAPAAHPLHIAVSLLSSLHDFITSLRSQFDDCERLAEFNSIFSGKDEVKEVLFIMQTTMSLVPAKFSNPTASLSSLTN